MYFSEILARLTEDPSFGVCHVETSDRKDNLDNLGRMGFLNVAVALRAVANTAFVSARFRPHIVYVPIAQNALAYLRDGLCILAGKLFGAKVVVHLHGSYFRTFYETSNALVRWFVTLTMKRVDGAIVLGAGLKSIFEPWLEIPRVHVLPNFAERMSDNVRQHEGREGVIRLAFLGNILASKGIFELLTAMEILAADASVTYTLKFAGKFGNDPLAQISSKECRHRFDGFLARNRHIEYVGFLHGLAAKERLFRDSDIFVFPSWNEGQPIVLLEAMAAGLPIVSSRNTGAIGETVIDGVTGILVNPRNPREIAEAIRRLAHDADIRHRMSVCAVERYESYYTINAHMRKLREILESFFSTSPVPTR